MSKKIFIIFGHNRYKSGSSFNAAIRDTFIEEAKKIGHEIDLVNVYDEKQIKFWDGGGPDEQILDYRKRLEQIRSHLQLVLLVRFPLLDLEWLKFSAPLLRERIVF